LSLDGLTLASPFLYIHRQSIRFQFANLDIENFMAILLWINFTLSLLSKFSIMYFVGLVDLEENIEYSIILIMQCANVLRIYF